jgi:hypothetical protein
MRFSKFLKRTEFRAAFNEIKVYYRVFFRSLAASWIPSIHRISIRIEIFVQGPRLPGMSVLRITVGWLQGLGGVGMLMRVAVTSIWILRLGAGPSPENTMVGLPMGTRGVKIPL